MKTIRMLRSTGADLPRFSEGQVVSVQDSVADLLCGLAIAELLKAVPDEPLKAVPDNPTIVAAEQKLAEIKEKWAGRTDDTPAKPKRQFKTKPEIKE